MFTLPRSLFFFSAFCLLAFSLGAAPAAHAQSPAPAKVQSPLPPTAEQKALVDECYKGTLYSCRRLCQGSYRGDRFCGEQYQIPFRADIPETDTDALQAACALNTNDKNVRH